MIDTGNTVYRSSWTFLMVGVDSNRIFEVYTANTAVKTYLVGYTGQGVTFFTNAVSKATATTGSYVDVDISADTGSDMALAGIFIMKKTTTSDYSYALRKKGSTDDFYYYMRKGAAAAYIVGLDANEVAQQKIENTDTRSTSRATLPAGPFFSLTQPTSPRLLRAAMSMWTSQPTSAPTTPTAPSWKVCHIKRLAGGRSQKWSGIRLLR